MDTNTRIFRDQRSDLSAVLRAITQIAASGVPATVWTDVANDPSYRPFHRALAVYELFNRHLARPATLEHVAFLLAGGRWLLDAAIDKVELMGGEVPVQVPIGGAAFVIRLAKDAAAVRPEVGIYLALDRALDARLLRDALMSRATDASVGQVRIVDFAVFPEALAETNSH
jgi:hypothetical protein